MLRVHCVVPEERSGPDPSEVAGRAGWIVQLKSVSAAIARGKHPAPFRTRKLSLSAPMVLQVRTCGRVGRRRTTSCASRPPARVASRRFRHDEGTAVGRQTMANESRGGRGSSPTGGRGRSSGGGDRGGERGQARGTARGGQRSQPGRAQRDRWSSSGP